MSGLVRKMLGRQSPALLVAMLALFVALSGTAVATTSALITGRQIANGSITGLDVKNRSLRPIDFRGSLRGRRGLAGPKGDKGDRGETGPAGPFVDVLPPGKTLKGGWVVDGYGGDFGDSAVSYDTPLPSGPTMHFIQKNAATPAGCTGSVTNPGAAPGHACFFVGFVTGTTGLMGGIRPESGLENGPGSLYGVVLYAQGTSPAGAKWETMGTWAVTAPIS